MFKIHYDSRRCTGCRACAAACKQEHNLPVGVRWRVVSYSQEGIYPNIKRVYKSNACVHCVKPKCLDACLAGAITKDEESGIVMVDHNLCNGCRECIEACPFNAMVYEKQIKKVSKCTYCKERIVQGLIPACVSVCMGLALAWNKTPKI